MKKIIGIFFVFLIIGISVFYYNKSNSKKILLKSTYLTDDNKTIAKSVWLYKLKIYKKIIDKNLLDILKQNNINSKRVAKSKNFVFYYYSLLNENQVRNLNKILKKYNKKIFINFHFYNTISFDKFKEKRVYPNNELFTPIEGFIKIEEESPYLLAKGIYGLEGADNSRGKIVKTTLNYNLQQKVFHLVKKLKQTDSNLENVIGILVDKNSGAILADAHAITYNQNPLKQKDLPKTTIIENYYLFPNKRFVEDLFDINLSKYHFEKPTTELPFEKREPNKFNFLQLIKFALPFFNGGYIINPHFLKKTKIEKIKLANLSINENYYVINPYNDYFYPYSELYIYLKDINKTLTFETRDYNNSVLFLMYIYNYKKGYLKYKNIEIYPKLIEKRYSIPNCMAASCDISVSIRYPQIKGSKYDNKINRIIKKYIKEIYDTNTSYMIDYNVSINKNILSILFKAKAMRALATNMGFWYKSFNFDLNTGKEIVATDILKTNPILLKLQIYKLLKKKYKGSNIDIKPEETPLDTFFIKNGYIYFYFGKCSIACCAEGNFFVKLKINKKD